MTAVSWPVAYLIVAAFVLVAAAVTSLTNRSLWDYNAARKWGRAALAAPVWPLLLAYLAYLALSRKDRP